MNQVCLALNPVRITFTFFISGLRQRSRGLGAITNIRGWVDLSESPGRPHSVNQAAEKAKSGGCPNLPAAATVAVLFIGVEPGFASDSEDSV